MVDGPLLRTTQGSQTDYWNGSRAVDELTCAIGRGATGATSDPSIVLEVMWPEGSARRARPADASRYPAYSHQQIVMLAGERGR
jgi:hypothetical protein